jgi:hypothetical protein
MLEHSRYALNREPTIPDAVRRIEGQYGKTTEASCGTCRETLQARSSIRSGVPFLSAFERSHCRKPRSYLRVDKLTSRAG